MRYRERPRPRRHDAECRKHQGTRSSVAAHAVHRVPELPASLNIDITCARRNWSVSSAARVSGVARVSPIRALVKVVEPIFKADRTEVFAMNVHNVLIVPGRPADPLPGSVKYVLSLSKGYPTTRRTEQVLDAGRHDSEWTPMVWASPSAT